MTERPLRSFFEKDKGGRSREITVTDKEFYAFCSSLISGKGETDSLFGNIRKDSANKWLSRRLCRLGITVQSEKTVGCKAIGISIAPTEFKEDTNPIDDSEVQNDYDETEECEQLTFDFVDEDLPFPATN